MTTSMVGLEKKTVTYAKLTDYIASTKTENDYLNG